VEPFYRQTHQKTLCSGADGWQGRDKLALLGEVKLPSDTDRPVVGVIMNFDEFQGAGLIASSLKKLAAMDIQLVICGSGDQKYEKQFREFADANPDNVSLHTDCPDSFIHLAIAGFDILLMPGKIESCGMLQMFAMSYGTIPVAYAGGGIVETIEDYSEKDGSGFIFHDYTPKALLGKLDEAVNLYLDSERWQEIVDHAMSRDFGWKHSAEEYGGLYRELLES